MKFYPFLSICLASLVVASSSFADKEAECPESAAPEEIATAEVVIKDTPPVTEETESTAKSVIKNIPPATDEQKKAIKQALELFYVSSNKIIIEAGIDHAERANGDLLLRTILEGMAKGFEQMLTGKLKDQLPDFFISQAQKTHSRIIDFYQKTKDIKNLGKSPEFQAFSLASEQQDAILGAYLKREIGQTLTEAINETLEKIDQIYEDISSSSDDYPVIKVIQNDIENAKTDEERENLERVLEKEIYRLVFDQLDQQKK